MMIVLDSGESGGVYIFYTLCLYFRIGRSTVSFLFGSESPSLVGCDIGAYAGPNKCSYYFLLLEGKKTGASNGRPLEPLGEYMWGIDDNYLK